MSKDSVKILNYPILNVNREFNIRITMILDKEYLNRKKLINKIKSVKEINQYAFNKTDYESVTLLE